MKSNILFLFIALMQMTGLSQSASAVYPLTSTTATSVTITGDIFGSNESFGQMMINNYNGPNSSQRVTTLTGSWPGETQQNDERFIQFAVHPLPGNNFTVTSILMDLGAAGGGNMRTNIRYSTDSTFTNSVLLNSSVLALPSGAFLSPSPNYSINHTVYDGETFYLRIYPWYTSSSSGKYVCPQNVTISGTTTAASLITISVNELPAFGAVVFGNNSASQSYTVSGAGLTGDITITAPEYFTVSSDNLSFSNSLTLPNAGGAIQPTTVYTKFSPTSANGSVSGAIQHTSPNAGTKYVNVEGIAIAHEPTSQSAITFGTVTGSSIEVNFPGGNGSNRILVIRKDNPVNWTPTDGVIISGVNSNFLNANDQGDGNKVVYDGIGSTITVNGLMSNVNYHFAVYEYNVGTSNSHNYLLTSPGTGNQTTLAVPTIIVNPENLSFGNVGVGITSVEKTYTISAATLSPSSGNITISAPEGYQVSTTSGSGFSSSLNIPYSNGSLNSITVFVRFTPVSITSFNGSITNSGGSAPQQNVEVSGSGMIPNSQQNADIIVSQDGTGDFVTIQEAINSIPANNSVMKTILIKNGTYNEKLFISNSFITLVGEDRENTKIIYAELRSIWLTTSGGSDWGAATVNINNNVTNLVLANLTIYNNYGSLYGSNDHQFAIRGATADKIVFINCDIKADGGDTVSLWNTNSGKYYHYNCYFEGYVDFVCPRGWCYITDSRFYQRSASASASIWHDGNGGQNAKLVIRHSRFDGVPNFALGRHHQEAQFFLLDNTFSFNMKNQPIFHAVSNPPVVLQWGLRYYYFNNHRDSVEFDWYSDNLDSAQGSPSPNDITAEWTFSTAPTPWNPEAAFPQALPNAEFPTPRRDKLGIGIEGTTLNWIKGRRAVSHDVYFGTTNPPPFIANQTSNSFNTGQLEDNTVYYWRIDAVSAYDTVKGEVWSFSTKPDTVIPVELSSFTAASEGDKVKLEWVTSTEKNNMGFDIERKTADSDWRKIGFVEGKGTTTEKSVYSFTDKPGIDNISTSIKYRLRQVDFDGSYSYSKEVEVDLSKPGSFQLYQNYPNPFNPDTNIKYEISSKQFVTLKIYDTTGRELKTLINEEKEPGYYTSRFSVKDYNISSGVYFYQLKAGEFIQTRKMTLLK